MINLEGKTALITGGSRGIGAACVDLFRKSGSKVAFTFAEDSDSAEEIVVRTGGSPDTRAYRLNLGDATAIRQVIENIISDYGKIDILVNNAGIWKYGEADRMTLDNWEETIKINLTGTFLVTREIIPVMKRNGFGRIINITSTAGQRGEAFHSHYAASKGALISFTKSLAVELAPFNITTNSVAPGWVDTDMCKDVFSDAAYREGIRKSIPLGMIATGFDIAGPVLFLASGLASHINGEILNVNGGSVLCG